MVATVEVRIFLALLSPSYEKFVVTLRMATLSKILVLCVGFALSCNLWAQSHADSMQTDTSPLKIERDALGAVYYWIDNNALDLDRVDYSNLYETYLTPIEGRLFKDCTQQFIDGKLQLEPTFLKTYSYWNGNAYDTPVNGVLGNDFRRIEVYFYPDAVKLDSVTYFVKGRTKVKKNVCDFTGEVKIKKIYHKYERDIDSPDCYLIIADYTLKEDITQKGSGEFRGVMGAYGYVTKDAPGVIQVNNIDQDGDGYMNRSYVGTWRSYKNPAVVKRCMWGDNRLPFRFDFDIGAGEIVVNPKYSSPEWDNFMQWKNLDIVEPESGDSRATYKNPWW